MTNRRDYFSLLGNGSLVFLGFTAALVNGFAVIKFALGEGIHLSSWKYGVNVDGLPAAVMIGAIGLFGLFLGIVGLRGISRT